MKQEIAEPSKKANHISVGVSKGDITKANVDAIATVIRPDLEIKGSLNNAIFQEGGSELDDFILENIIEPREGDIFTTPGFDLISRNIIFGVVPAWRSDLDIVDKHLLNAARGITNAAKLIRASTLAIPLICCGKKGYPLNRGIRLILQGVSERVGSPLKHIEFICDDEEAVQIYRKRLGF